MIYVFYMVIGWVLYDLSVWAHKQFRQWRNTLNISKQPLSERETQLIHETIDRIQRSGYTKEEWVAGLNEFKRLMR